VATKEELLALFRKRRGYTKWEQETILYQGEEVDWRHVHSRNGRPGGTMPWDWIPCAQAVNPPEGMTIAFLGAHRYPPYILRKKAPEELVDEPPEDWVEEPLEWIERPPSIRDTKKTPQLEGSTEMSRTQIRRAHRKAKAAAARGERPGKEAAAPEAPEIDEGAKAIETERRVSEYTNHRGPAKDFKFQCLSEHLHIAGCFQLSRGEDRCLQSQLLILRENNVLEAFGSGCVY
jgi:hypothetical protein